MADHNSELTSVDPVSLTEAQPDEAALLDSAVPWRSGSAPSPPSVDNEDDQVSSTAQGPPPSCQSFADR